MRIAFTTLGCRLNQFETEGMRHRVEQSMADAEVVGWDAGADVYVVNSCAVTGRAEQKCRQLVRGLRRRHPAARVMVVGCYSQLAGDALARRLEVDAVLGNEEKRRLDEVIPRMLAGEVVAEVGRYRRGQEMAAEWIDHFGDYSRATLKVQEGCDLRCTFCAIWKARGPSRSRLPRAVVAQAQRLAASGYEEIVLAGVHLGHYGRDLTVPTDLCDLLDMLLELVDERVRFRLSSIDPGEVSPELVAKLVGEPRLCRYLHLPLQSGSDAVLTRMRRAYTAATYRNLVEDVVALDAGFGIGADVIVGFPGETEAEFEETVALLETLAVSFYHVFRYSDRQGTPAERMSAKVPGNVAATRSERIRELGRIKRESFLARQVGRVHEGIVESIDEPSGLAEIMLDTYATIWAPAGPESSRRRVAVRATLVDELGRLRGQLVGRSAHRTANAVTQGEATS